MVLIGVNLDLLLRAELVDNIVSAASFILTSAMGCSNLTEVANPRATKTAKNKG